MATIAVLGLGLLGSGFAENLLNKGHTVQVWNRTASKAAPLVQIGAVQASTPADAVRGAERVHLVLSADAAVDTVIAQLREGLGAGVPIVDHSTNLPAAVASRSARLLDEGVTFIHAPVFMGPKNSRTGTGLMLVSGPQDTIADLEPALRTMTGRVDNHGERPEKAAALKLIGNGMLLLLTGAMGELFELGSATGVSPDEVVSLFEVFGPTPAGMGRRVLASGEGPVGFEMSMARKDAGLMLASGGDGLVLLPAIAARLDRLIAEGRGAEDFTAMARLD